MGVGRIGIYGTGMGKLTSRFIWGRFAQKGEKPKMLEPLENVSELYQQARSLLIEGKWNEAVTVYEKVIEVDPSHEESWIDKGFAVWKLGQHETAIACYDAALDSNPRNAIAWLYKGNALKSIGQQDDALSSYDRALEIDPMLANAWYNKGDELGQRGRVIEAKACFENAYKLGHREAKGMIVYCEHVLMNELYG